MSAAAGASETVSPERLAAARRAIVEARRAAPNLYQRHRTSKDNDAYARDFFGASRLHFIGSWKARFEAICDTLPPPPPLPRVAAGEERVVLHIDMDCFFASVAAALRPELAGLPLAVSWGESTSMHAEIASASYEARAKGVRNGMWIPEALRCCPELLVAPYEFEEYEKAAEAMYRIVFSITPHVMGVSVDECYAEVTGRGEPLALASALRQKIKDATKCNASIGIGPSRLIARLATARAKPNGQLRLTLAEAREMLVPLPVSTLPGIGYSTRTKLQEAGIETCGDLAVADVERVQGAIGVKHAERLRAFANACDDRAWESRPVRKTVGAQASWGVRFAHEHEAERFVHELAAEVAKRLAAAKLRGRSITIKLWRAMIGAPGYASKGEMGHGACDNLSRTLTLERFTADARLIGEEGCKMLRELQVAPADIRGVGLAVGRLEGRPGSERSSSARPTPARVAPAPPKKTYSADRMPFWWSSKVESVPGLKQKYMETTPSAELSGASPELGAASSCGPKRARCYDSREGQADGPGTTTARNVGEGVMPSFAGHRKAIQLSEWATSAKGTYLGGRVQDDHALLGEANKSAGSSSLNSHMATRDSAHATAASAGSCSDYDVLLLDGSRHVDAARDALVDLLRSAFLEASLPAVDGRQADGCVEALTSLLNDAAEALLRLGCGSGACLAAARDLVHEGGALGRHALSADVSKHAILSGEGKLAAWLEACDAVYEGLDVFARTLRSCPSFSNVQRLK